MFDELKTFIAVVEFKNFTRAGEYLNLSQPSVSTHIKNLENYFNVTLINRSIKQKTIHITESGYKLYEHAKEILNLLEVTYLDVKNSSNSLKGTLKIGASLTIGEYILPKFLSYFTNKYPDIEIELIIENTSSISSRIKDLSLDIGLIEGAPQPGNITQDYFLKDSMVIAFPYDKDLDPENFKLENLNDQKWIVREEGSGTREFFNTFMQTNKLTPKKIMVLGSNYAIKEAVKNNLGITLISSLVTANEENNNEFSLWSLNNSLYRYFSYIIPQNITLTKATSTFLEELKLFYSSKNK